MEIVIPLVAEANVSLAQPLQLKLPVTGLDEQQVVQDADSTRELQVLAGGADGER